MQCIKELKKTYCQVYEGEIGIEFTNYYYLKKKSHYFLGVLKVSVGVIKFGWNVVLNELDELWIKALSCLEYGKTSVINKEMIAITSKLLWIKTVRRKNWVYLSN